MEFLTTKNDTSLFAMGSHTKKRPHNIVLVLAIITVPYCLNFQLNTFHQGRTYDGHVLDMFEFGVGNFESISQFSGFKKAVGSKPVLVFLGDQWNIDTSFDRIRNFFIGELLDECLRLSNLNDLMCYPIAV